MSERDLNGKVILITGGTQGVGEAVARACARAGAQGLIIGGRNSERGGQVARELSDAGCPTHLVAADLSSADACRGLVAAADREFGRLDGVVNAAGATNRGTIDDTSVELWDFIFAVNVRAPFIITQDAQRLMKREKIEGSIVNILSVSAVCGPDFLTAYSTSKGALMTLTRNTAHSLRQDRIRVNGINLGWTDTPNEHKVQLAMGQPENWLELAEDEQPFGRLVKPSDAASLSLFLLSPQSGIMTGAIIDLDQNILGAEE